VFAKHHYLNHSFNKAADTFVMYVNDQLAGFTSALPFVHPRVKNTRQGHRTVVLPDFQGIGLGVYLRDFIADHYLQRGLSYITTTSNPALVNYMTKSPKWICTRFGRTNAVLNAHKGIKGLIKTVSGVSRITTSWKYVGDKKQ
jgi:GNAT superfamily N-acetyltransferase